MPAVAEATIPIIDDEGSNNGSLVIRVLPKDREATPTPLLDLRQDSLRDDSLEPVQLLEGAEYVYGFTTTNDTEPITSDRPEMFDREMSDGRRGRLRPGQIVGTVPCRIEAGGRFLGHVAFEVRSRKLDYLRHYRWMLRDIADHAVEAILEHFAPAELKLSIGETMDSRTMYHAFAFLAALLESEEFTAAIHEVLYRPFVTWEPTTEMRRPGQGISPSSDVLRQLARAGPRVLNPRGEHLPHLPASIIVGKPASTVDNPPNQFVKHALELWRNFALTVRDALLASKETGPVGRGLRETEAVLQAVEGYLANPALADVGVLERVPLDSQVLQKRQGYREILRGYLQFQTISHLSWDGGDDVFSAGQRDVATLYEYWTFFQVLRVLADICDEKVDPSSLLTPSADGLTLTLKRGRQAALVGRAHRLGRDFIVRLFFNRTFSPDSPEGSWTRAMRPDCSIKFDLAAGASDTYQPAWVHFDAKYRVDFLEDLFGPSASASDDEATVLEDEEDSDRAGSSKRSDLLKMHAYRDAIRRTAGAYVLYPGSRDEKSIEYHELLPGLGAFGLQPREDGHATGLSSLRDFLQDVMTHLASQTSQHERERFWRREAYERADPPSLRSLSAQFLTEPPADTRVLLGYVRTTEQLDWIHRTRLYNLRADPGRRGSVGLDSKELASDLVLLHGRFDTAVEIWRVNGQPRLMTAEELRDSGYQSASGRLYYCLPIEPIDLNSWTHEIHFADVLRTIRTYQPKARFGEPVSISWLALLEAVSMR